VTMMSASFNPLPGAVLDAVMHGNKRHPDAKPISSG
jgi:hypothetical protein